MDRLGSALGFGTGNDLTKNTSFTTQYLTEENKHKLNEGWESMPDPIDPSKTIIFKDTDFQDLIYQTAYSHSHNLTVSGGNERSTLCGTWVYGYEEPRLPPSTSVCRSV
ncbi:MAG: hypothetical protein ACLUDU_09275 [Butyricimonas faecihominis]